jgi:uncharacterized membrane protein SpoIIM required for sporulation
MTSERFASDRRETWRALEDLVALAGSSAMAPADRRRLGTLYRAALSDLGLLRTLLAREGRADSPMLTWLNAVVAGAHACIAQARRGPGLDVRGFLERDFPRAVRAAFPRIGLCAALLAASAVVAYLLCANDVTLARLLAGPTMSQNAEGFTKMGQGRDEATDSVMAAFYVTNNVQVSFVAFALGITFGVGTLWTMIQNGMLLGVTLALVRHHGATSNFLGFVASHGFIELTAIVLAAGAGLGLGRALIAPGAHGRVYALKTAGRESVTLVIGAACLLLLAAFFEAFVSPSAWSLSTKLTIGAVNLGWLLAYLLFAGRSVPRS